MIRDILVCLWFLVAAGAFFAPYLGFSAASGAATALYAVVLISSVAALALRLVERRR